MMQSGFDIIKLCQEAQIRWLKPVEVLFILQNHEKLDITHKPPQKPPSGSLFLFNRRVLRYFRNDGHSWRKKTNGKTVREGHERLKVGNSEVLHCYYAHGEQNSSFQRRSYWMLDPAFEHIVLVHYREVVEGRCMLESILSSSNDSCPTLRFSTTVSDDQEMFPTRTTEFDDLGQNSYSPGSVEEVCSQFIGGTTKMSHSNKIDRSESCNQLSLQEFNEALRKLEEQLSLDKEDGLASSKEIFLPPGNLNVGTNDLQLLIDSQEEAIYNSLDESKQTSNDQLEDGTGYNIVESSDGFEWPEADTADYSHLIQGTDTSNVSVENDEFFPLFSDMGFDHGQFGAAIQTESSLQISERHLFTIREISPEWAFSSGSTKVIITGDFHCSPSEYIWTIVFGDAEVPLEFVQHGVLRCLAPPHTAGKVKLCITSGKGKPCSEVKEFEYREKLEITNTTNASQQKGIKSSEELLLLAKLVQLLLPEHITATVPQEREMEQEASHLRKSKESNDMFESIIGALFSGSMASDNIMEAIVQVLVKDKLQQWLSFKHQKDTGEYLLSKRDQCIIHMISGMGFQWALKPILDTGISINCRDPDGWTALHWAAYFGREEMVAALLASGASARAVTNPSVNDPEGKTPASLAAASGHKGLAGYLSETALTSHLFSLTTEKNESLQGPASVEIDRGVDSISRRSPVLYIGTEDQLSLKDSLAAVRNATQAASRIQAAFRVYSFKKQQKTATCEGELSSAEIHGLFVSTRLHKESRGYHDQKSQKAALLIQKNYWCWKKRKEFLLLRKHVVKIQARVRGRLARKKYNELLRTVNVLEKIILRWHRRGVGLRGFHAEPARIDEEDEDIIKVFRKQKVDRATDEALSRVLSVVDSPKARQQYRRMLESYQQAEAEHSHES